MDRTKVGLGLGLVLVGTGLLVASADLGGGPVVAASVGAVGLSVGALLRGSRRSTRPDASRP